MGKKAKEIVKVDIKNLLEELKKAYCDEWLAYHSYHYMALNTKGKGTEDMSEILEKTAKEELEHADELAKRIIEIGGNLVVDPKKWEENANAPYPFPPENMEDKKAIDVVINAERTAIEVYQRIADLTYGKDHLTYQLACHILQEEVNHEENFENLTR
ncbi:MAG: ferritin [Candidatus Omnitrophica bacterium]|jgi:bacterioferritin|nr:ferritin [Candidatus Omnitrophota bacterium]